MFSIQKFRIRRKKGFMSVSECTPSLSSVSSSQTESDRISTKHEGERSNYGQLDRKSSSLVLGDASDSHRGRYKLNSGDRCCNAVFLTSGQNLQRRLLSQTDQLAEPRLYWDSHAFLRSPGSIRIDFQLSTDPTDRSEVQCHLQSKQRGQNSNTILRGAMWHVDQEIGCEDTKSVQNSFTSSKNLGKKKVSGPKSEIWEMCKLPNTEIIDFDRISNSIDFKTVHIWAKALPGHETFFLPRFFHQQDQISRDLWSDFSKFVSPCHIDQSKTLQGILESQRELRFDQIGLLDTLCIPPLEHYRVIYEFRELLRPKVYKLLRRSPIFNFKFTTNLPAAGADFFDKIHW